ncbi:hypothetical protein AAG906_038494 [Vitis piasezkii]
MEERERVRERKNVRERDSGGDGGSTEIVEGESHARPGKNVRKGGFGVESKTFEVEVEERRGRLQATIVERKGGISSWVRLGPVSLGIVLDCLILSIEDVRMGRWVREWQENGREYSLTCDYNRGGCFLRLGVADLERKRFSIFIPKEEEQRSLGCENGGIKSQKEDEPRSKANMAKTYAEATNMARGKERTTVRVEVTKEEVGRNLIKLEHCVVGTWNPNAAKGDDLRGWGTQLTRIWSLKGNLGLAKMERGKVLMEFEFLTEAEQVSKLGSISFGGLFLRLEKERSSEAWVRVVGLPVSLWERDILRRIGEACGGFLAVDYQTEKMEELQWARLLVKRNGETLPNAVEVWIEESCYSVTLWWEVRPVMKVSTTGKKGKAVATGEEVGGDVSACASECVTVAMEGSRLEDILLTADGTRGQSSGSSQTSDLSRSDDGSPVGLMSRVGWVCWAKQSPLGGLRSLTPLGLFRLGRLILGLGSPLKRPSLRGCFKGLGWTTKAHLHLVCLGPRRRRAFLLLSVAEAQ